ncbi:MAG TPA: PadR family transcriptional regulator [Tepidiformaceae bacterium]|jgi:DNA-binding PadR family transcriptional regulator
MSLRFAILGLLAHEELSGYELTKRFQSSVVYFWEARSQQIYPELTRMEEDSLVRSRLVEQVGRPDKRLYSLTERGLDELTDWVTTPSPLTLIKDDFMLKVYSYGMADPEAARQAVATQRRRHEERLAELRRIEKHIGVLDALHVPDRLFGAYLTLQGGMRFEEAFIAWCRETESILATRARPAVTPPSAADGGSLSRA